MLENHPEIKPPNKTHFTTSATATAISVYRRRLFKVIDGKSIVLGRFIIVRRPLDALLPPTASLGQGGPYRTLVSSNHHRFLLRQSNERSFGHFGCLQPLDCRAWLPRAAPIVLQPPCASTGRPGHRAGLCSNPAAIEAGQTKPNGSNPNRRPGSQTTVVRDAGPQ
ncbi:hypothetical protein V6N13_117905 [Hibiscus sabdariffa]